MATNRQLAQQTRRYQERHLRLSSSPQLSFQELAQQTRRIRELEPQEQPLPIARRPPPYQLTSTVSFRHQLGRCNISCQFCGAHHWIEERIQNSTKQAPKFSTCCGNGAIMMDKFEDPPEPLYSLLMDSTPCIFLCQIFTNDERLPNSGTTFAIITTPLHSVPSVSKETSLFMVLKAYIPSVSKDNCVISSDLYSLHQENNLHFHRSICIIQIPWNKHNIACLIILICLM